MVTRSVGGEDRVLTIPNAVTLIRLACVPVFVWLLTRPHHAGWWPAAVLLAVLGATDWVDGQLARRLGQVSTVGKVLDPLADRLLLAVAAVSIIAIGAIPLWLAIIALVREAVVAAGFLAVAALGGRRFDVLLSGKAGTFGLMCALPLFLAGHTTIGWHRAAEDLAWAAALPALALGWFAAYSYLGEARLVLRDRNGQKPPR
jgi:cardiolipin synthase